MIISALLVSLSQAAWVWETWAGANPEGGSGSFDLTPLYANYEDGHDNSGVATPTSPSNAVNRRGWDRAPESFQFSWSSANGEPVEFEQVNLWTRATPQGYSQIDLHLDPDGNGDLPDSLTLSVVFPFDLVVRNTGAGGGLGLSINPITQIFNSTLSSEFANGTAVSFDSNFFYGHDVTINPDSTRTYDQHAPTSYPGGVAAWSEVSGNGDWHGLANGFENTATYFPWPAIGETPDQGEALGQQTFTLSNFRGTDTRVRLSFDGGVPELSNITAQAAALVPEPSSFLLLTVSTGLLLRRKRK